MTSKMTTKYNQAYESCKAKSKRNLKNRENKKKHYLDKVENEVLAKLTPSPSFQSVKRRVTDLVEMTGLDPSSSAHKYLLSSKILKTSSNLADLVYEKPLRDFVTGSSYSGQYDSLSFSGYGRYYYPHGVIYEGEFKNGHFHGEGTLIYPNKQKIAGTWRRGKLKKWVYKYADDLEYHEDWDYLRMPDRAYQIETANGFGAPRDEYIAPKMETTKIPPLTYDTGDDGFYNDGNKIIYSKDYKMRRIVEAKEVDMIKDNYRQEGDEPVKYRPELYEYWCSGKADEVTTLEKLWNEKKKDKPTATFDSLSLSSSIYSVQL